MNRNTTDIISNVYHQFSFFIYDFWTTKTCSFLQNNKLSWSIFPQAVVLQRNWSIESSLFKLFLEVQVKQRDVIIQFLVPIIWQNRFYLHNLFPALQSPSLLYSCFGNRELFHPDQLSWIIVYATCMQI